MTLPTTDAVRELLRDTLTDMVAGTAAPVADPPDEVKPLLDSLLTRASTMRDGMLTLLGYVVASGTPIDFRAVGKFPGGRAVAQYLADDLLPSLNIEGKKDALQTGFKGVSRYIDRENNLTKPVLEWASDQTTLAPVEQAFRYLAAGMAATSRELPPMPELDTAKLTFGAVFGLLDELLQTPSGGAHEQMIFAALLEAYLLGQLDEDGVVDTKHINASDASAGTAADVQHRQRGQVQSAYEVTANDWRTKVKQAVSTMATHELRRVAILGHHVVTASGDEVAAALPADQDVTVLDVREEARSLVARLDKKWRREALKRLYTLLVDKQSDDSRVRAYVDALAARGLTSP